MDRENRRKSYISQAQAFISDLKHFPKVELSEQLSKFMTVKVCWNLCNLPVNINRLLPSIPVT